MNSESENMIWNIQKEEKKTYDETSVYTKIYIHVVNI